MSDSDDGDDVREPLLEEKKGPNRIWTLIQQFASPSEAEKAVAAKEIYGERPFVRMLRMVYTCGLSLLSGKVQEGEVSSGSLSDLPCR